MAKLSAKKLPVHFWSEESGLTSMFILLCFSNFIATPFLGEQQTIKLLLRITWFVLLFAGITTLSKSKAQMRIFAIIPVLLIVVSALELLFNYKFLAYLGLATDIAVFALLIGMVLVKVFEPGSVTVHRVIGSIVVYILLADLWAVIFQFLYIHLPGSLLFPDTYSETGVPSSMFLYFSFTTLTTTGYGDILPAHSVTRTLVIIEQLIGVLYPVVLIGRLVGMVVVNKEE